MRFGPLLLLCLGAAAKPPFMKAISYGPVPLKEPGVAGLAQDDWMVPAAKPMWGLRGRDDLQVMKDLGANTVRLYGNNPNESHVEFLGAALALDLQVVPGMSDFPYIQMTPGKCIDTNYDCFNQSRDSYALNLQTGFLTESHEYHPALSYFILVNEPDLKLPGSATTVVGHEVLMARAVVSAFDGLLEAERLAKVTGNLINITATFSYAVCIACGEYLPALGQMQVLADAMMNPEAYGYTPQNNVTEAYLERWVNSFNTNNPARDLEVQFFQHYPERFEDVPVFIAEYHSPILQYLNPPLTLQEDLEVILEAANTSDLFFGISFFQYQVAYWKGGTEMDFGLFGLGNYLVSEMPYYGATFKIWCLEPRVSHATPGSTLPQVLTDAFEGAGLDYEYLCQPNPHNVPLTAVGYGEIEAQTLPRLAIFVRRVAEHMGAVVVSETGLEQFTAAIMEEQASFGELVTRISYKPSWTSFGPAACVADRHATEGQVGQAISWLCGHAPGLDCAAVPEDCQKDAFSTADWLFSRWYLDFGQDPLHDCNFGGAAIYRSSVPAACVARRLGEVLV